MQSWFVWFLSMPKERVFLFSEAAVSRESRLLQCSNAYVECLELAIDDGSFPGVINLA